MKNYKESLSLSNRKQIYGFLFCLPFIIGFLLFYLMPLIRSFIYSFSKLSMETNGLKLTFLGLKNYKYILFQSPEFIQDLTNTLSDLSILVPVIIIYSFFIAVVLNQKFFGRTLARVIFFIPVIICTGILATMSLDVFSQNSISLAGSGNDAFLSKNLSQSFLDLLPVQGLFIEDLIKVSLSKIYTIVTSSGVQIVIFLAGMQSISPSLYEASAIEGATSWETFWKITFPMLTPLILFNTIYTIIDVSGNFSNKIIARIYQITMGTSDYGMASALSWLYTTIICLIVGLVWIVISKMVFYENK